MRVRMKLIAGIGALTAVSGAAVAAAAEPVANQIAPEGVDAKLIERPGDRLRASIQAQQELERLARRLSPRADQASALGIDVDAADVGELSPAQLKHETDRLRDRLDKAESSSSVAGVSRATLESIAACESGGDPTRRLLGRHISRQVPVRPRHVGVGRRQRRPRRGAGGRAGLPRRAAVFAQQLEPVAGLRLGSRAAERANALAVGDR